MDQQHTYFLTDTAPQEALNKLYRDLQFLRNQITCRVEAKSECNMEFNLPVYDHMVQFEGENRNFIENNINNGIPQEIKKSITDMYGDTGNCRRIEEDDVEKRFSQENGATNIRSKRDSKVKEINEKKYIENLEGRDNCETGGFTPKKYYDNDEVCNVVLAFNLLNDLLIKHNINKYLNIIKPKFKKLINKNKLTKIGIECRKRGLINQRPIEEIFRKVKSRDRVVMDGVDVRCKSSCSEIDSDDRYHSWKDVLQKQIVRNTEKPRNLHLDTLATKFDQLRNYFIKNNDVLFLRRQLKEIKEFIINIMPDDESSVSLDATEFTKSDLLESIKSNIIRHDDGTLKNILEKGRKVDIKQGKDSSEVLSVKSWLINPKDYDRYLFDEQLGILDGTKDDDDGGHISSRYYEIEDDKGIPLEFVRSEPKLLTDDYKRAYKDKKILPDDASLTLPTGETGSALDEYLVKMFPKQEEIFRDDSDETESLSDEERLPGDYESTISDNKESILAEEEYSDEYSTIDQKNLTKGKLRKGENITGGADETLSGEDMMSISGDDDESVTTDEDAASSTSGKDILNCLYRQFCKLREEEGNISGDDEDESISDYEDMSTSDDEDASISRDETTTTGTLRDKSESSDGSISGDADEIASRVTEGEEEVVVSDEEYIYEILFDELESVKDEEESTEDEEEEEMTEDEDESTIEFDEDVEEEETTEDDEESIEKENEDETTQDRKGEGEGQRKIEEQVQETAGAVKEEEMVIDENECSESTTADTQQLIYETESSTEDEEVYVLYDLERSSAESVNVTQNELGMGNEEEIEKDSEKDHLKDDNKDIIFKGGLRWSTEVMELFKKLAKYPMTAEDQKVPKIIESMEMPSDLGVKQHMKEADRRVSRVDDNKVRESGRQSSEESQILSSIESKRESAVDDASDNREDDRTENSADIERTGRGRGKTIKRRLFISKVRRESIQDVNLKLKQLQSSLISFAAHLQREESIRVVSSSDSRESLVDKRSTTSKQSLYVSSKSGRTEQSVVSESSTCEYIEQDVHGVQDNIFSKMFGTNFGYFPSLINSMFPDEFIQYPVQGRKKKGRDVGKDVLDEDDDWTDGDDETDEDEEETDEGDDEGLEEDEREVEKLLGDHDDGEENDETDEENEEEEEDEVVEEEDDDEDYDDDESTDEDDIDDDDETDDDDSEASLDTNKFISKLSTNDIYRTLKLVFKTEHSPIEIDIGPDQPPTLHHHDHVDIAQEISEVFSDQLDTRPITDTNYELYNNLTEDQVFLLNKVMNKSGYKMTDEELNNLPKIINNLKNFIEKENAQNYVAKQDDEETRILRECEEKQDKDAIEEKIDLIERKMVKNMIKLIYIYKRDGEQEVDKILERLQKMVTVRDNLEAWKLHRDSLKHTNQMETQLKFMKNLMSDKKDGSSDDQKKLLEERDWYGEEISSLELEEEEAEEVENVSSMENGSFE